MQKNSFIHTDLKAVCNSAAKKLAALAMVTAVGSTGLVGGNCRFTASAQMDNNNDGDLSSEASTSDVAQTNKDNAVPAEELNNVVESSTIQTTMSTNDDDDDDDDADDNLAVAPSENTSATRNSDISVSPSGAVRFCGISGVVYGKNKGGFSARIDPELGDRWRVFNRDAIHAGQSIPEPAQGLLRRVRSFLPLARAHALDDLALRLEVMSDVYCLCASPGDAEIRSRIAQDILFEFDRIERRLIGVPVAPEVDRYANYMKCGYLCVTGPQKVHAGPETNVLFYSSQEVGHVHVGTGGVRAFGQKNPAHINVPRHGEVEMSFPESDDEHPREVPILSSSIPVEVKPDTPLQFSDGSSMTVGSSVIETFKRWIASLNLPDTASGLATLLNQLVQVSTTNTK